MDCELISVDFSKYNTTNNDTNMKGIVEYKITYSEYYIPVGTRNVGENYIQEVFTLVKNKGKYIITDISPIF